MNKRVGWEMVGMRFSKKGGAEMKEGVGEVGGDKG